MDGINLPRGMTYNYRVADYNASGPSTFTMPVQASTTGTPSGQIILSAATGSGMVSLSWDGLAGTVEGYIVQRANVGATGPFADIQVINGDVRSYNDTNISPTTDYWYRVTLLDGSMPSNTAYARTLPSAPAAPTNLNAVVYGATEVRLSWLDNSTDETGFVIQRQLVNSPDPPTIITIGANITAYIDTTVNPNSNYEYLVYATNAGVGSAIPNRVTATTPPAGLSVAPPIPAFAATPLNRNQVVGVRPFSDTFANQTNTQGFPGSTTYLWNFGDGLTSTLADPIHTYTEAGTYDVTLTAAGPGGVNSLIKIAYVKVKLVADGSLTCVITPAEVVATGRWRIAGSVWMVSGATLYDVPPGTYPIEFLAVPGYRKPNPVSVSVISGAAPTITATYQKVVDLSPVRMLLLD